jgi:predicted RNA-binding Zn ribbon-like protein
MVFSHDTPNFAHDTVIALAEAAALVNTLSDGVDELADRSGLDRFFERFPFSGKQSRTEEELAEVRQLRERLRTLWTAKDRTEAAAIVNELLREANAQPYLTKHDELDWHLHVTRPDAPLAQRIGAESAMGFLDLIRADDLDRLRICGADDCSDVLVDMSKNRSKRYCDTGNCGNRTNVAAYRARQRAARASMSTPTANAVQTAKVVQTAKATASAKARRRTAEATAPAEPRPAGRRHGAGA